MKVRQQKSINSDVIQLSQNPCSCIKGGGWPMPDRVAQEYIVYPVLGGKE